MILTAIRIMLAFVVTLYVSTAVLFGVLYDRNIRWFHPMLRWWARTLFKIFGIRVHVTGTDRISRGRAYIYAANHASMFDILAVQAGIPDDVHIMFKKELGRVPIWGWALALSPYIKVDRSNPREATATLEQTAEEIRAGKSVLIYPEGTRTRTGALQPFKRGAFSLALRAGVPVVPVTINHTFGILRKGSLNVRSADIELVISDPIPVSGLQGRDAELQLMERVRAEVERNYVRQGESGGMEKSGT